MVGSVQGPGAEQAEQDPVMERAPGQQDSGENRRGGPPPGLGGGDEGGSGHDEDPEAGEGDDGPHRVEEVAAEAPGFPEQPTAHRETSGQESQEEEGQGPCELGREEDEEKRRAAWRAILAGPALDHLLAGDDRGYRDEVEACISSFSV